MDLLLHRYGNVDYILQMDIEDGFELIVEAYKQTQEDKLWELYLVDKPNFTEETYMDWEQYKAKAYENVEEKPVVTKEEALDRANKILNMVQKGGNK